MQNYQVSITKSRIAEAVYRLTANAERERGDDAHVATSDNESVVFAFIEEAVVLLNEAVERYGSCAVIGENVVISISMPENWGDNLALLEEAVRMFCENYAIARWFELNGTAERFNEAAGVAMARVKKIFDRRVKPIR